VGVVAQRLLRTVCPHCRAQYYPPADFLEMIHYRGDRRRQFVRGEGCRQCHDTGFRGRTGIYEILGASRQMRELISKEPDLDRIRECHARQNGTFLLEEGIRLAEAGKTSLDEVIRVTFVE
jgi:type II secretory ATPase GspE/PulE/Tfp pilus assembly ATPase PilB-like protein